MIGTIGGQVSEILNSLILNIKSNDESAIVEGRRILTDFAEASTNVELADILQVISRRAALLGKVDRRARRKHIA